MSTLIEPLLYVWRRNGKRAQDLFANIPDDRITEAAGGLKNHPAWVLSHLIHYHRSILSLARGEAVADPAETPGAERYGSGSQPSADAAHYLSRAELIERFTHNHAQVEEALTACRDAAALLAGEPGLERWKASFGTRGVAMTYMMVHHESHHLAEIADWKKALGIPVTG